MISTVDFDNPGKTVLKPVKLAHVVLRTNNFLRLSSYYQTFLQAQINFENDFMHLLTYDDEHHRIGIVNMDIANKDSKTCGLEHIAFSYSSLTDLAMSYLQRKENGIEPFWCINHVALLPVCTIMILMGIRLSCRLRILIRWRKRRSI
ncbi:uncharacterized protein FFNC_10169 [Fusarium fujikuroi]|nr:uncharacterized protein FFNC_10169 [Fusarium fujikuroi]SCV48633.1 uncharacterized protein FFFS_08683 [Fusarium fujikuroi]